MRGFMLDSARALEGRAYYERFIDFIADRGADTLLWHFTDDQGCSLRFDALPEAASPNAYTKSELRELLKHAQTRGVSVIPELETLGHTRFITRADRDLAGLAENDAVFTSICPVHPRTREIIGALIDEVCELFDSRVVHVGLDEVNFGDHPLTKEALRSRSPADLFGDYLDFLHGRLARHGRRLMMWGDHLLKDDELAARAPKDILVANWQYTPMVPETSTRRLQQHGFEVVSCGAMISHDQPLFPGDAFAIPNVINTVAHAKAHSTSGVITTVWTPQRFLPSALWPAVHFVAEVMARPEQPTIRDSMRRFAEGFYGFSPSEAWLDAMRMLFRASPMRKPWIAALKLELDERLGDVDLAAEAARWRAVCSVLRAEETHVDREHGSYRQLLLMTEILAYVWGRAARYRSGTVDAAVVRQGEDLGARIAAAWDHERFASDPRKRTPVFTFDADDHLLIAFERGTRNAVVAVQSAGAKAALQVAPDHSSR